MSLRTCTLAFGLALLSTFQASTQAACPFCSAQSAVTYREEIQESKAVVLVRSLDPPLEIDEENFDLDAPIESLRFEVVNILKSAAGLEKGLILELPYFGKNEKGSLFRVVARSGDGDAEDVLSWGVPEPISEELANYLRQLPKLSDDPVKRLRFYLPALSAMDENVLADAYDEFARAPYEEVEQLKESLPIDWIKSQIELIEPTSPRRSLFFVFLSISGSKEDAAWVKELIESDHRTVKTGLDATLACYLSLAGADGVKYIEDKYFKREDATYSERYAAIQALRFHAEAQESPVPRDRIVKALHLLLDNKAQADMVLPDLARWGDWSVLDRAAEMYRGASDDETWIRPQIVNYVRACPLDEAKKLLTEFKKIDPESYQRGLEYAPLVGLEETDPTAGIGVVDKPAIEAVKRASADAAEPTNSPLGDQDPVMSAGIEEAVDASQEVPSTSAAVAMWIVNTAAGLAVVGVFLMAVLVGPARRK